MQNLRAVHILHPSQQLIHKELTMIVGQRLWAFDYTRQVGLKKLHDHVDLFE
jgi:hypothetical protein